MRQKARDDHADADLICGVATALRDWGVHTGQPPPLKILREAVWFYWHHGLRARRFHPSTRGPSGGPRPLRGWLRAESREKAAW